MLLMVMATTFVAPPALKALFGARRAGVTGSGGQGARLGRGRRLAGAAPGPVVFTNGVFDLLHPGHVELLEAARREGAALVVGREHRCVGPPPGQGRRPAGRRAGRAGPGRSPDSRRWTASSSSTRTRRWS